jgi:hypothetical protein
LDEKISRLAIDIGQVWLIKARSGLGLQASLLALSLNSRTILRQNPGAASDSKSGLKIGDITTDLGTESFNALLFGVIILVSSSMAGTSLPYEHGCNQLPDY